MRLLLSNFLVNQADPYYRSKYPEELMASMFSASNGGHSEAELLERVATLPSTIPMYFLGLSQGKCLVVHSIRRYPANLLDHPTDWDDQLFGTVGDVDPDGPFQTVSIPDDFFALANDGNPLQIPVMDHPFQQPVNGVNVQREAVLRKWILLPPKYAALLLRCRLSPKELWMSLVGAICADDSQDTRALRLIVDWVTVACISPKVLESSSLSPPLADSILLDHRKAVTEVLYPALYQQPPEEEAELPPVEEDKDQDESSPAAPPETSSKPKTINFSVPFTSTNVEVRETLLYGAAAGAAIPLAGAAALAYAGFGAAGIAAGSWAAGIQTATTAAGGWFATCQSLGATGILASSGVVASSAAAGAGVGAVCGTKVTEEHADTTTIAQQGEDGIDSETPHKHFRSSISNLASIPTCTMVSFRTLAAPLLLVLSSLLFTTYPVVADEEEDDHLLESPPNLPLGDINIVVLTDVHSWIAGHSHKEPYLNVDYGEVLSFYQRLKAYCDSVDMDLWIVMNGDWVDGTGLSLDGDTSSIVPLLQKMPFDIVNTGNHELYKSRVVDSMTRAGGFIDWWGGRHLSSNIVMTSDTSTHLSNRYYLLEGINSNVLVFGFIYHMFGATSEVTVLDPADVVQESWFQKALKEESYDAILVMAHMGTDDPAVDSIITAIRSHVGDTMPVQFVTGHTHMRRYSQVDEYSKAVESGRYLDTVGFISFPTRNTVPDDNSTAADLFQHVFLDANVNNLKYALGGEHEFATDDGQELSDFIQRTREHMGLDEIIGCSPGNYYMNYTMSHKESLWGLFRDEVVPVALQGVSGIQSVLIISSDNFRYDLFYGENSYDDIIAVAPFDDTLHFVGQMPCSTVLSVYDALVGSYDINQSIPYFVLAGTALANETCELYVPDFDLSAVVAKLEELFPDSSYVPIATGHSTTTLWVDFVESEWACSSSLFDVPKVLDDSGNVVWKNLTLVILIVLAILFGLISCLVLGWKLIKCICYGRTSVTKEELDSIVADRDMTPQFT